MASEWTRKGLLLGDLQSDANRSATDVNRQHRTHIGDEERLDLGQSRRQRRADLVGGVVVVDMVYRDGRLTVADDFGHSFDQCRMRLGDRADPLIQHQTAVDIEA